MIEMPTPSARTSAISAIAMFVPVTFAIILLPRTWWTEYLGILFHLALFLLVPRLSAPDWAKAAGYGWLLLDVTVGIMALNQVPQEVTMPIRLGGHVFAGLWIVSASFAGSAAMKLVGVIAGVWLFSFSFVSPFLPYKALAPATLMVLLWLAIIALQNGSKRTGPHPV
ncbi:hypothetical protein HFN80_17690 [Rhizobium laguerreae]|uniref:hypothetical protein n=1 Tax=Rhizobium laguerreae TaxID=1076926 RepID=UPI001C9216D5|nr:hypothetical protein [Rhizobium laguerreae]MBY3465809.1 hypothetical protein [Rhizobium laguerreae]